MVTWPKWRFQIPIGGFNKKAEILSATEYGKVPKFQLRSGPTLCQDFCLRKFYQKENLMKI
jgi:hypothetical protein